VHHPPAVAVRQPLQQLPHVALDLHPSRTCCVSLSPPIAIAMTMIMIEILS
jgi:hypothetical protein